MCSAVCLMQENKPDDVHPQRVEDCQSDVVHAQLLAGRVTLHDGVWIVVDNIRCHEFTSE